RSCPALRRYASPAAVGRYGPSYPGLRVRPKLAPDRAQIFLLLRARLPGLHRLLERCLVRLVVLLLPFRGERKPAPRPHVVRERRPQPTAQVAKRLERIPVDLLADISVPPPR